MDTAANRSGTKLRLARGYPVELVLPSGERRTLENDQHLIEACKAGLLRGDSVIVDNGTQIYARDFSRYRWMQKESWVRARPVWIALIPIAILSAVVWFNYDPVDDSFGWPIVMASLPLAGAAIGAYAYAGKRKLGYWPWCGNFFKTAVGMLFLLPIGMVSIILGANCWLDKSPVIEHSAVVIDKKESHTKRRGRRDHYYVHLSSWRADLKHIELPVSAARYRKFSGKRTGSRLIIVNQASLHFFSLRRLLPHQSSQRIGHQVGKRDAVIRSIIVGLLNEISVQSDRHTESVLGHLALETT